mmetsp:Transcript_29021/g.42626  ORF Transcript_29021/g.42626 Transcript_29021/m.42626 type:complete len:102 (+) Transcript_29021:18-323(+)
MTRQDDDNADAAPKKVQTFTYRTIITLHAVAILLFAVSTTVGHHWSAGVISDNRLAEVKTQLADMSDHPAVILVVGIVPLAIVTYLQVKGSISMGMKVKDS